MVCRIPATGFNAVKLHLGSRLILTNGGISKYAERSSFVSSILNETAASEIQPGPPGLATPALLSRRGGCNVTPAHRFAEGAGLIMSFSSPTLHRRWVRRYEGLHINLDHLGIFNVWRNIERTCVFSFRLHLNSGHRSRESNPRPFFKDDLSG